MRRKSTIRKHLTEQERVIEQFVPGMYVLATTMVIGDSLRGIVEDVDKKCQKVYVAWNGGPVKQHDPSELMPAETPVFQQPAPIRENAKDVVREFDVSTTPSIKKSYQSAISGMQRSGMVSRRTKIAKSTRQALYHAAPGRMYKRTRAETSEGEIYCPDCKKDGEYVPMERQRFKKSDKMYVCPECGWKIQESNIV